MSPKPDKCPACGCSWPLQDTGRGCECCTREYYEGRLAATQADYAALAETGKGVQKELNAWRAATRLGHMLPSQAGEELDRRNAALAAAQAENERLQETCADIVAMTDAGDAESYRCDAPNDCLDAVHAKAQAAAKEKERRRR